MPSKLASINWDAARAFYLALPKNRRTYAATARRFGVTADRVGQVARRDGWPALAERADAKAEELAVRRAAKTQAERNAQTLKVYDLAVDLAVEKLELDPEIELPDLLGKLPALFKAARLAAGESTEHVLLADVQPVVISLAQLAVRQSRPEARAETLELVREALGGIVQFGEEEA